MDNNIGVNTKSEFQRFINVFVDNELRFNNLVESEDADGVRDTAMIEYKGRIKTSDLELIKDVFGSDQVEIGESYISVRVPEELQKEHHL